MKKNRIIAAVVVLLLLAASAVIADKWSDYADMSSGTIADLDTFMIRDVSDTSLAATGTQKEYPWSVMKVDIVNALAAGEVMGLMKPVVLTIASGVHDGDNDAATLTDSGETFTASQFVGMTVYNINDESSCTVTANDGTTVTCTLAGGTGDAWDTGDAWQVGPGPLQSGSMFLVTAASTIRHPATKGYTALYMSNGTAKLTIDMASVSMVFKGTLDAAVVTLDAGDSIDSSGSTGDDFIGIVNISTTAAKGLGKRGTWVDGGAD